MYTDKVKRAIDDIQSNLEEQQQEYVRDEINDCIRFKYGFYMKEYRLGPVNCTIYVTDDFIACESELAPAVCVQRRKEVEELISRINKRDREGFCIDLKNGVVSHFIGLMPLPEFLSDTEIDTLIGWGVHSFGQYNSAFYSVMMNDADPEFVFRCMGSQDVEFLPDGRIRWFMRLN